jgi:hypothetical protein
MPQNALGIRLTQEAVFRNGYMAKIIPEAMLGLTKNLMIHQSLFINNVQQNSFKVLSKSCQENKCFLTYSISFKTTVESSHFQSEVKKIAEIQLVDGRWLIAEVSNVKTYHEAMEPINALEQ